MAKTKKSPRTRQMFILDGSVALAWCFADEADTYADAIANRFPEVEAVVPALWHLEVANALLVGERRRRCDAADVAAWTAYLAALPISVDGQTDARAFGAILSLARAHTLSTYDAAYLELAQRRGLPLATLDRQLQAAAIAAGLAVFMP